ncbi:modification methylase CeqI [Shouchella clausii]|uniref:Modification methylase CeqI n=1 Tax=Shouchella rhizosphaerae TaxID=866786 RepID=A0ABZ2CYM6_9BACI|nr:MULTISPECIES: hypothetical protein [Shouchella]ALA53854.1 response regulator aspartate phosphatase [Shouchella clausii]MBU3229584.1 modification methylase CeqI [Shouchella clausii]MBU3265193.1 modification methylase CeqI [Shouchella clausii]MBU3506485.1 modification methylase CeqI [Shouchella clausii]MBU3533652.1 modification methylase CeqI [Shouchella clausii]
MSTDIAPEMLGAKIVEWYRCIVARDMEQVITLKNEVERFVETTEIHDEKVLSFYSLVMFRYQLLMEDFQKRKVAFPDLEIIRDKDFYNDKLLKFLYYFVHGQAEFYQGRYKSAIRLYHIAEGLVNHIQDKAEKAEFFYRLGESYYRIDQYTFAVAYIEQAIDLFEQQQFNKEKFLNCKLLLAAINTELSLFDKAEFVYQSVLSEAKAFPTTHALVLRSLGMNRTRQHKLEEARQYFIQALNTGDHRESVAGMKSSWDLANILFRLQRDYKYALSLLQEAKAKAESLNNEEYIVRCSITETLFVKGGVDETLLQLMKTLEEHELYFEYDEMIEEIILYYQERDDLHKAISFTILKKLQTLKRSYLQTFSDEL